MFFSGKSLEHPGTSSSQDGVFATLHLHELEALTWSQLTYLWRHRRFCSAVPIRVMSLGKELQILSSSLRGWCFQKLWFFPLWRRIILVDLSVSYIVMLISRCRFFGFDIEQTFNMFFNQKSLNVSSWSLKGWLIGKYWVYHSPTNNQMIFRTGIQHP